MSMQVILQNASQQVELHDASVYGFTNQSVFPGRNAKRTWSGPSGREFDLLVGLRHGNREVRIITNLMASTSAIWIANYQEIEDILLAAERYWLTEGKEGAKAYLYVQPEATSAQNLVFDVMAGQINTPAMFDMSVMMDNPPIYPEAEIVLHIQPFGRDQTLTSTTSSTLNNGGGASATNDNAEFTTVGGQVNSPVKITFQSAAGDIFRRVLIGKKSRGTVSSFIFALNCETGTYTGYTVTTTNVDGANAAVAAAHAGNVFRWTAPASAGANVALLKWTLTNPLNFKGTYRVFMRFDKKQAVAPPLRSTGIRLRYGGDGTRLTLPTATIPPVSAVATRNDFLVELGTMTIPDQEWPSEQTLDQFIFSVELTYDTGASGDEITDFDCIYLLPIDEGQADVTLSANSSAQDQLVLDAVRDTPLFYLLDSSGNLQPSILLTGAPFGRFNLREKAATRFYTLAVRNATLSDDNTHDLTDQYTIKAEYYNYYSQFK